MTKHSEAASCRAGPSTNERTSGSILGPVLVSAVLGVTFIAIVIVTWAHWGHVTIDCGGALDRAARIAGGQLLYRDVLSPYGPLADYAVAAAFRAGGIHLNVAYAVGLTVLAAESCLLWYVGRRFLAHLECAVGLAGFWILLAFRPGYINWVLPNTFAATFGSLFATATVALLIADIERPRDGKLIGASVCAAGAALSKVEFGLAAYGTLVLQCLLFPCPARARLSAAIRLLLPGLVLIAAVVLLFASLIPWQSLLFDNLYRIRSFRGTVASLRTTLVEPVWPPVREAALRYGLEFPLRAVLVSVGLRLAGRPGTGRPLGALLVALGLLVPLAPGYVPPRDFTSLVAVKGSDAFEPIPRAFAWSAVGWSVATLAAFVRDRRAPSVGARAIVLVGGLSVLLTLRWDFHVVWAPYYAPFAPFLPLLAVRVLAAPLAGGDASLTAPLVIGGALVAAALNVRTIYGQYGIMLDYPRGRIWAPSLRGAPLAAVIDYVRATTSPEDYVAVIPEERLINFLAERRNPTRDSGIGPAWLATAADERAFVRELKEKWPRAVVVSQRSYPEFQAGTVRAYNPRVIRWIERAYRPAQSAGPYITYSRRDRR